MVVRTLLLRGGDADNDGHECLEGGRMEEGGSGVHAAMEKVRWGRFVITRPRDMRIPETPVLCLLHDVEFFDFVVPLVCKKPHPAFHGRVIPLRNIDFFLSTYCRENTVEVRPAQSLRPLNLFCLYRQHMQRSQEPRFDLFRRGRRFVVDDGRVRFTTTVSQLHALHFVFHAGVVQAYLEREGDVLACMRGKGRERRRYHPTHMGAEPFVNLQ